MLFASTSSSVQYRKRPLISKLYIRTRQSLSSSVTETPKSVCSQDGDVLDHGQGQDFPRDTSVKTPTFLNSSPQLKPKQAELKTLQPVPIWNVLVTNGQTKKDWSDSHLRCRLSQDSARIHYTVSQIRELALFFFFYLYTCHTFYAKAAYIKCKQTLWFPVP